MKYNSINVIAVIIAGVTVVWSIWVMFFAPCKMINWLPAQSIPGRCLDTMK